MMAWFAGQPLEFKIALGGAGALLFYCCLWLFRRWLRQYLEWQNVRTLDIKERVGLKVEFVKTAAQIVGGLFFILTILVAFLNYQETQKKNEADREQAQEKQVTELYVQAIGQLGSDKLPVVLGGIYALERIARTSQKDKGPILEVLTAYVRQNAPWPPEDPAEARKRRPWTKKGLKVASAPKTGKRVPGRPEQAKAEKGEESKPEPDTDIQAVLTVLGRLGPVYNEQGKPQPLDLRRTDLRGADLHAAPLERANFYEAHLERANLEEAHLERAVLDDAYLKGANLVEAHLEGANLVEAHLEGAKLGGAQLEWALLPEAHLEGANLFESHLEWAHLDDAHLEGADMETVSGLTQAQINATYCDAETKLPPPLKCSKKKKPSP